VTIQTSLMHLICLLKKLEAHRTCSTPRRLCNYGSKTEKRRKRNHLSQEPQKLFNLRRKRGKNLKMFQMQKVLWKMPMLRDLESMS